MNDPYFKTYQTLSVSDLEEGKITLTIPYGYYDVFAVRTYKTYNGEKVYSEYAYADTYVDTMLDGIIGNFSLGDHVIILGTTNNATSDFYIPVHSPYVSMQYIDGLEIYYSEDDGEYSLIESVLTEDMEQNLALLL